MITPPLSMLVGTMVMLEFLHRRSVLVHRNGMV